MGDILNPWHILSAVMTAFTALLTWIGSKQLARIDALEKEKASISYVQEENRKTDKEFDRVERVHDKIFEVMNDDRKAIHQRLDNIFNELVNRQ